MKNSSSRAGMILGITSVFVALFPFVGSDFVVISFALIFFLIPISGTILGILGLVFSIKGRKLLTVLEDEKAIRTTKGQTILGIITSVLAIVISVFLIGVFLYFTYGMKAPKSDPIGDLEIHFFGEPNFSEVAVQSILLPDSSILTTGFSRHIPDSDSSSGTLIITNRDGGLLARKYIPGTKGHLAINDDGVIMNARACPYPVVDEMDAKTLTLYQLNTDADVVNTKTYPLSSKGSATGIDAVSDGFLLFGTYNWADDDSTRQIGYIMKIDASGDSIWTKHYSSEFVGRIWECVPTVDSGYLILGMRDKPKSEDGYTDSLKISRVDSLGNLVWFGRSFSVSSVSPAKAFANNDGTFIILSQRFSEEDVVEGMLRKISSNGEVIWAKPITFSGDINVTDFIPWREDNWLVVGWTSRKEAKLTITSEGMNFWDTYVIIETDAEGNVIHEFNGVGTKFSAWGVVKTGATSCVITGFGTANEEGIYKNRGNQDIGLIFYKN